MSTNMIGAYYERDHSYTLDASVAIPKCQSRKFSHHELSELSRLSFYHCFLSVISHVYTPNQSSLLIARARLALNQNMMPADVWLATGVVPPCVPILLTTVKRVRINGQSVDHFWFNLSANYLRAFGIASNLDPTLIPYTFVCKIAYQWISYVMIK